MESLLQPSRLWTRSEVVSRPSPVPRQSGIYAWYFRVVPPGVPVSDCHRFGEAVLLYVGISPKAPSRNGFPSSRQHISSRIRYHYRGNAEGSTLRLTLGCLLSDALGLQLRRVGSGKRMTFSSGESVLSEWMAVNALVTWTTHPTPWQLEEELIAKVSLPLNLDMNDGHPFHGPLSRARREARVTARDLPVLPC